MEFNYEEYEKACEMIREENGLLLELFEESLSNLKQQTARKHIENAELYLNEYLLYEDALTFDEGIWKLDDFLGYFFIRKCMWSTPSSVKSTASSIKKFYKCMLDHEKIQRSDYEFLCETIKERMPQWQRLCEQYNDMDEEDPFF